MRPVLLLALAAASASFLEGRAARAQAPYVPPPPPPPMAAPVLPHSFTASGQYYDASLSGVRSFVETYRATDPQLYAQLDAKAADLEAMRTRGWIVGLTTAGIGLGMVVGGFLLYKPTPAGSGQTPDFTPILIGGCVGVPLVLFSYYIGNAFAPGRTDFMDFVNYHNRLNPDHPLTWQLGWNPAARGPMIGATVALPGL
jgi:hypothetical protein